MEILGVHITLWDIVVVLLSIVAIFWHRIQLSEKIPVSWQKIIDGISEEQIRSWIREASKLEGMTGTQRRDYVAGRLQEYALVNLEKIVPKMIAAIIVEWCFHRMNEYFARNEKVTS